MVDSTTEEGHPRLAEGTSQRVGAKQPHAGPQGEHEGVVFDPARQKNE